ncbi:hypothetical protein SO078_24485 (plasmid) [Sinorhizobium meliloti]|uniref:hypothetical protein n=1 Tax=Rhizobium meliloti TaxID=382 RepID=UPI002D79CC9C|nr:hypothetical protein [Sinorhizobium meliloti]WRQ70032.1 hypothetical protein SO078_24485 [Sinorhizobium meliloti]
MGETVAAADERPQRLLLEAPVHFRRWKRPFLIYQLVECVVTGLHDVHVADVTDSRQFLHQIAYYEVEAPERACCLFHNG